MCFFLSLSISSLFHIPIAPGTKHQIYLFNCCCFYCLFVLWIDGRENISIRQRDGPLCCFASWHPRRRRHCKYMQNKGPKDETWLLFFSSSPFLLLIFFDQAECFGFYPRTHWDYNHFFLPIFVFYFFTLFNARKLYFSVGGFLALIASLSNRNSE
jgi:hypothetical protein